MAICEPILTNSYSINDALQDGHLIPNMFSTRSNSWHSSNLRPVQKLYNHQSALELESLMDDDLRELCNQLQTRFVDGANKDKTCDIADWISFFAWDFMAHTTWSKRIGFMEKAEDVGGMLGTAERVMRYFSVVCIIFSRASSLPSFQRIALTIYRSAKSPLWTNGSAKTPTGHALSTNSTISPSPQVSLSSAIWSACKTLRSARGRKTSSTAF
jgi:hypothetical protein